MRSLSRWQAFTLLAVATVACTVAASWSDNEAFDDLWSELVYLLVGVLLTTFVLESLLTHDLELRRQRENAFAFRVFVGTVMDLLMAMVDAPGTPQHSSVTSAATGSGEDFATGADESAMIIKDARSLHSGRYLAHHVDVGNELRTLARAYVRVYSRSQQEMVASSGDLLGLASRWVYRDELSAGFRQTWESLPDADPDKAVRRHVTEEQEREALAVVRDTAAHLAALARRANRPGATLTT